MNAELKSFISDSDYSENTKHSVERLINRLDDLGYYDKVLYQGTADELRQMVIDIKPSSMAALSMYCSLLITYTKWLDDNKLVSNNTHLKIANFDRVMLWKLIKPNINRFLSHKQFVEIVNDIDKYEEENSLYYQMLISTIYEGVYTENLISLTNMTTDDLSENVIRVHGKTDYDLTVSENLINGLKELSKEEYWYTQRAGVRCKYKLIGDTDKSVFKICQRINSTWDYKRAAQNYYYKRFRKIAEGYIGYKIQPLQIFISGLMWRICNELTAAGIESHAAFDERNRNTTAYNIVAAELARTQYNIRVSDLKFIVRDDIDIFTNQ
ncbi:MAG: hypothetical protein ACI4RF_04400 [Eubacterium sp.]